jgi:hypothetical protein
MFIVRHYEMKTDRDSDELNQTSIGNELNNNDDVALLKQKGFSFVWE